jgi:hypothetical protein
MIVAVLGRRVRTIVVVTIVVVTILVAMLIGLLFAVIFRAILRTDGDRDHGGEGERRDGKDKRFPRMLMHGQSSTDCLRNTHCKSSQRRDNSLKRRSTVGVDLRPFAAPTPPRAAPAPPARPSISHPMPIRAANRCGLSDLGRNQRQVLFRQSEDIDLNVQRVVRTEFSDNPPGQDVQILETFDDASECAGISVCDNPQPP